MAVRPLACWRKSYNVSYREHLSISLEVGLHCTRGYGLPQCILLEHFPLCSKIMHLQSWTKLLRNFLGSTALTTTIMIHVHLFNNSAPPFLSPVLTVGLQLKKKRLGNRPAFKATLINRRKILAGTAKVQQLQKESLKKIRLEWDSNPRVRYHCDTSAVL